MNCSKEGPHRGSWSKKQTEKVVWAKGSGSSHKEVTGDKDGDILDEGGI